MDTVHSIIKYMNDEDYDLASFASIQQAQSMLDEFRLRHVCILLLSWMKARHRFGTIRPLELDFDYEWSQDIAKILSENIWTDLFMISGTNLIFNPAIPEAKLFELFEIVNKEYNPRLMT
jgi:hypothetical protein